LSDSEPMAAMAGQGTASPSARTPAEVETWISAYIARLLALPEATLGRGRTFKEIGLDSMMVVVMTEELGAWLRRDIDPTTAYSYPTIRTFAAHVLATAPDI
jgi:acyl carrier protein